MKHHKPYERLTEDFFEDIEEINVIIKEVITKFKMFLNIQESDISDSHRYIFNESLDRQKNKILNDLDNAERRAGIIKSKYILGKKFIQDNINYIYNYLLNTIRRLNKDRENIKNFEYIKNEQGQWMTTGFIKDNRDLKFLINLFKKQSIQNKNHDDILFANNCEKYRKEIEDDCVAIFEVIQGYIKKS